MDVRISNSGNTTNSFQISVMGNVDDSLFFISDGKGDQLPFLIKNISEEPIKVNIVPYGMGQEVEAIETVLYPGWNVELVRYLDTPNYESLQYGY